MNILDKLSKGVALPNLATTKALATELAKELPVNNTIALTGDLGAGKTTFAQFLVKALGINQTVTSPTFNILNIYEGERMIAHIDAYRLKCAEDMDGLMLDDILKPPYCIIVEWANLVEEWFPTDTLRLHLSLDSNEVRLIQKI
jgi:tRNA threonylcarbamoyladenosine biosynthesis protein TsaE